MICDKNGSLRVMEAINLFTITTTSTKNIPSYMPLRFRNPGLTS